MNCDSLKDGENDSESVSLLEKKVLFISEGEFSFVCKMIEKRMSILDSDSRGFRILFAIFFCFGFLYSRTFKRDFFVLCLHFFEGSTVIVMYY